MIGSRPEPAAALLGRFREGLTQRACDGLEGKTASGLCQPGLACRLDFRGIACEPVDEMGKSGGVALLDNPSAGADDIRDRPRIRTDDGRSAGLCLHDDPAELLFPG